MAASIDMTAAGGPGGGAGGLGELITALARYSAALETIAGSMPDATTGPTADTADTGRETMAAPEAGGGLFASVGEFFKRQAPMATAMVAWLKKKPAATPTPEQSAKPVVEALKEQEGGTVAAGLAAGEPAEVIIDPALQAAIDANTAAQLGLEEGLAKRQAAEATEAEAMAQALQSPTQAMADALDSARKATAAAAAEYQAAVQAAADADQNLAEAQEAASAKALAQRKADAKAEHDAAMKALATSKAKAPSSSGQTLATPAAPGAAPAGGAMAKAGGAIAKAGGAAVGAATGGMAAGAAALAAAPVAFLEMVQGLAGKIGSFVDAVNPGIMVQLDMATRDLTAVIGTALAPIMQAIVPIIKDFASALLPVARLVAETFGRIIESLQPAIDAMTEVFFVAAATLMPIVEMVGDIFTTIAPIFTALAAVAKAIWLAFGSLVTALAGIMRDLFGFNVGDVLKDFAEGVQVAMNNLVAVLVRGIASLMKFFGFTSALANLTKFFKGLAAPKASAEGIAAAQNAQVKSIESVGRDAALAAVIASVVPGGKAGKKPEDFYADMVAELEGIGGNGTDLVAAINALPAKIASSVASLIPKPVKSAVQAVGSGIATAYDYTIGAVGRGIGSAAGALIYGS
jgi:hypothetical protein